MPFKLIVLGSTNDNKISLDPGVHAFGRDKLLQCRDKRISRQHGQLLVEETSIILKSLHINPCYYKKHGSNESEVLSHGDTVTLSNGDRFGLLLDSFWYEIVYVPEDKNDDDQQAQCDIEERALQQDINALLENEASCDSTSSNETIISKESSSEIKTDHGDESPSILNHDEPYNNINSSNENTNKNNSENEENSLSPSKRPHSDENKVEIEIKKIKKESEDESSNETKPSTSDQASTLNDNDGAVTKPPQPLRERCMYGANCYRKNPAHFAQFSHPRDADWGAGAQGVCPFGAACAKRDPRHWRDHTHPPGTRPPAPAPGAPLRNGAGKQRKAKPLLQQDVIVTGKRQRKAIRTDVLIDSDAEGDPYATDESDEWQPDSSSQDFSEDYF